MDISINQIDLKYLTNYSLDNHLNPSKQNDKYQTDLEFYKKRIFKLTKDLLRGHTVDSDINACFQNYTQKCIDYFEFIDKRDIIQEDYKDLKQKEPQSTRTFDLTNVNEIMTKKVNHTFDIAHLLNIKKKNTGKKIMIPKERNLNLKHPSLKNKGLEKKKNVVYKYEEKNKEKNKEKI